MEIAIAIVIGVLFAGGIYGILRRSLVKLILGIILLGQAANMLVFSSGGLRESVPVFVDASTKATDVADPIPQALVLTAIVIGFGLIIFSISLLMKAQKALKSDDINAFNNTDKVS